jgi:hypothetical protein
MKIFNILIACIITIYSCTSMRTMYSIEDTYPIKGKILDCTIPEHDCNGRQSLEVCIYKDNLIKEIKKYQNDSIIDSYLTIGADTVNRQIMNKKVGKWMEYIPRFDFLKIHYYVSNEIKYTFGIYLGDSIKIRCYPRKAG